MREHPSEKDPKFSQGINEPESGWSVSFYEMEIWDVIIDQLQK